MLLTQLSLTYAFPQCSRLKPIPEDTLEKQAIDMPLDHFVIVVPDGRLEEMVSWLISANAVFEFKEFLRPVSHVVGMGEERPYFWVVSDATTEATEMQIREWRKQHIAFTVESKSLKSILFTSD